MFVDGHVHLHAVHDRSALVGKALDVSRRRQAAVLLLVADTPDQRGFDSLETLLPDFARRSVDTTGRAGIVWPDEGSSLLVTDGSPTVAVAFVRGRQIVSSEGLEVLWYGIESASEAFRVADRSLETSTLVSKGLENDHLTVLPWGFGKWTGRRRQIVRDVLSDPCVAANPRFFVGDILARCWPWAEPGAVAPGLKTLPGTDVLPLRGFESRVADFGIVVDAPFDDRRPFGSLVDALDVGVSLRPVGAPDAPWIAIRDQLRYRLVSIR